LYLDEIGAIIAMRKDKKFCLNYRYDDYTAYEQAYKISYGYHDISLLLVFLAQYSKFLRYVNLAKKGACMRLSLPSFAFIILLLICMPLKSSALEIKQVVIWGHKLHSHTHSYIHAAFDKAFKHLGFNVLWLDNNDRVDGIDFKNSLFITEGNVDQKIPLLHNCYYVLHNCALDKYQPLIKAHRCLMLQVYTHDLLTRDVIRLDDYIYYQPCAKTLYMPWATDLLPHEIDEMKIKTRNKKQKYMVSWIGSICGGVHGNQDQINPFKDACAKSGILFKHLTNIPCEDHPQYIQESILAPAIQGAWQCEKGYIPCRIFKNISYGVLGITNSETVYKLFNGKIVYNPNTYQLFFDAINRAKTISLTEIYELMDFVKEKHTYIARIHHILQTLEKLS